MQTVKRLGNLINNKWTGCSFSYTVFDSNGICPSLNTCSGGGRQPMIVEVECVDTDNSDKQRGGDGEIR